ncbi:siderophore-interacting protein [Pseudonocardia endophytica]|uniref:NADPH-dependent ferric siderophore reductase n=1 Tax=Pseudonocardia endophytica TaxID=401976 RepID=A0A4R1I0A1_PSEEN|nr:siderophore-interacting protein [Pseudonocardia endophytica]TCK26630.1 NADPH-dependent ferric siderophore reductase [Pseudonocardia endophytica]
MDGTTLRVTGVRALSEPFVRIEAEVTSGALDLPGTPDEAIVLHFPLPDGTRDEMGRWYTVRRISPDGRSIVFDVVAHAGGVGAEWARRARVGDEVGVSRSACWFKRPEGVAWQILVGDAAGVPAIARIVDESPAELRTDVAVEVHAGDGPPPLPDAAHVRTVVADEGTSRLEEIVRGLEIPDGPGYLFVVGEAAATRAARRYLRHELGMDTKHYRVVGYWNLDAEKLRARYEANQDRFATAWAAAEAAGGDDEEVQDRYETTLAEAGLL